MNNIESIDPVGALVQIDFFLTMFWQDGRLAMPNYWNLTSQQVQEEGIRLGNSTVI